MRALTPPSDPGPVQLRAPAVSASLSLPQSPELCHNEPAHPSPSWAPLGWTFLSELPPIDAHARPLRQLLRQLQSRRESNRSVQRLLLKGGGGWSCSLVGRQHLNLQVPPRAQTCELLGGFVLVLHPDPALPSWGTQSLSTRVCQPLRAAFIHFLSTATPAWSCQTQLELLELWPPQLPAPSRSHRAAPKSS